MSDEVDPENPRPDGRYHVLRDASWYYVDDDRARSVSTGPAIDGEPGDDWILSFTAATRDDDPPGGERIAIRLSPGALHELWIETKDLSADARQAGVSAPCDLCGESVDLDQAIPNGRGEPCHRHCWADAYGAPDWFE
jgi:hypothetical protein